MLTWRQIVDEAKTIADNDPFVFPLYNKLIISKTQYSHSMSAILASHFKGNSISEEDWFKMLHSVFIEIPSRESETQIKINRERARYYFGPRNRTTLTILNSRPAHYSIMTQFRAIC